MSHQKGAHKKHHHQTILTETTTNTTIQQQTTREHRRQPPEGKNSTNKSGSEDNNRAKKPTASNEPLQRSKNYTNKKSTMTIRSSITRTRNDTMQKKKINSNTIKARTPDFMGAPEMTMSKKWPFCTGNGLFEKTSKKTRNEGKMQGLGQTSTFQNQIRKGRVR